MLGVPVGFEVRVDLAVDHEHAGRAFGDPGFDRIEIGRRAHRGGARAVAAGYCGEIGVGEFDDVGLKALPAEVMNFSGVRRIVVDQDAHAQAQTNRGLHVGHRH